jgi:hypothetical protein
MSCISSMYASHDYFFLSEMFLNISVYRSLKSAYYIFTATIYLLLCSYCVSTCLRQCTLWINCTCGRERACARGARRHVYLVLASVMSAPARNRNLNGPSSTNRLKITFHLTNRKMDDEILNLASSSSS